MRMYSLARPLPSSQCVPCADRSPQCVRVINSCHSVHLRADIANLRHTFIRPKKNIASNSASTRPYPAFRTGCNHPPATNQTLRFPLKSQSASLHPPRSPISFFHPHTGPERLWFPQNPLPPPKKPIQTIARFTCPNRLPLLSTLATPTRRAFPH